MPRKKILILGASGMLGHVFFMKLLESDDLDVFGTVRNNKKLIDSLGNKFAQRIINGINANNFDSIVKIISVSKPDVIINCIGIIKQIPESNNPIISISMNSLLPHKIAEICNNIGARFIHFSTDCVFDGKKGNYSENDISNAIDLYGRTKYLGEVSGHNCVTVRTSIIGHELNTNFGLIEWFLSQKGNVSGYKNAIFSGFPTIEVANILIKYIIPNENIEGLYHLSSEPISKYDLLTLVAENYKKDIKISRSDTVNENRSLDSAKFRRITGYNPPKWQDLIEQMHDHYINSPWYN